MCFQLFNSNLVAPTNFSMFVLCELPIMCASIMQKLGDLAAWGCSGAGRGHV
jgi:hypothetical protein